MLHIYFPKFDTMENLEKFFFKGLVCGFRDREVAAALDCLVHWLACWLWSAEPWSEREERGSWSKGYVTPPWCFVADVRAQDGRAPWSITETVTTSSGKAWQVLPRRENEKRSRASLRSWSPPVASHVSPRKLWDLDQWTRHVDAGVVLCVCWTFQNVALFSSEMKSFRQP